MSTWRLLQASVGGFDRNPHRTPMTQIFTQSDSLDAGQLRALQSLAERQPGQDANFVNIAAAQALTVLGLARRGGGGWEITPLGRNHLLRDVSRDDAEGVANAP
ncbi:hypothetical protein [Caulobacter sp. RL271]|jgi:hypothetical protein|uniref:Uncharacterized protein n=1 Tax=Caulobacter segnis TaxID=88688 RepID=A0ABY4ZWC5_9CAUL|nr:hypothetical protein [Caulobacter segnis]USQ96654.1 hypothetical protein MZV50_03450 [Caulobacter segnis]